METRPETIRLAGSTQTCPCHVCAFFRSKEEEDAVLLPFMAEGFEAGANWSTLLTNVTARSVCSALQAPELKYVQPRAPDNSISSHGSGRISSVDGLTNRRCSRVLMSGPRERQFLSMTRLWSNQEWALEASRVSRILSSTNAASTTSGRNTVTQSSGHCHNNALAWYRRAI